MSTAFAHLVNKKNHEQNVVDLRGLAFPDNCHRVRSFKQSPKTIRPKFQKATIRHKRQFVPF